MGLKRTGTFESNVIDLGIRNHINLESTVISDFRIYLLKWVIMIISCLNVCLFGFVEVQ